MPQAGIDPPPQSHASNEASALHPSHHGWMCLYNHGAEKNNKKGATKISATLGAKEEHIGGAFTGTL